MQPNIIRRSGFTWLALPREGVRPLKLLERTPQNIFRLFFRQGRQAEYTGSDLFALFPAKGKTIKPEISDPRECAFFNGTEIIDRTGGAQIASTRKIPLLGNTAAAAKLSGASRLLYSFDDVTQLDTGRVRLDSYLSRTPPDTDAHTFIDKLQSGNLYVVTDVLQTAHFRMMDISTSNFSGDLSMDAIRNALKAEAAFDTRAETQGALASSGKSRLTFALKAVRIFYNKPAARYSISSEKLALVKSSENLAEEDLPDEAEIMPDDADILPED